jgi:hypothetical protein
VPSLALRVEAKGNPAAVCTILLRLSDIGFISRSKTLVMQGFSLRHQTTSDVTFSILNGMAVAI